MFNIIDNQNSPMPNTTSYTHVESNLNGFIPIFLSKLQGNFTEMMVFSTNAPDQHLLLDTVAPSSICSEHWLHRAQWNPLKKFQLSPNTPPFRFAGRPICALYGVQLAATITDIKGRPRTLKLFAYVLPSTPISFLLESLISAAFVSTFVLAKDIQVVWKFQPGRNHFQLPSLRTYGYISLQRINVPVHRANGTTFSPSICSTLPLPSQTSSRLTSTSLPRT